MNRCFDRLGRCDATGFDEPGRDGGDGLILLRGQREAFAERCVAHVAQASHRRTQRKKRARSLSVFDIQPKGSERELFGLCVDLLTGISERIAHRHQW